jgi:hypothetical protein
MSATARTLLVNLDARLVKLNSAVFPAPGEIKSAVNEARDLLEVLLERIEALEEGDVEEGGYV